MLGEESKRRRNKHQLYKIISGGRVMRWDHMTSHDTAGGVFIHRLVAPKEFQLPMIDGTSSLPGME